MDQGELAAEAQARAGRRHAQGTDSLRVSIVLPAYNEEPNIGQAIAESRAAAERLFGEHEIIVVDDGSRDATAAR
ncbi:MAG: glycosyltransferase, partial [Gemmatimonadales bacterium]